MSPQQKHPNTPCDAENALSPTQQSEVDIVYDEVQGPASNSSCEIQTAQLEFAEEVNNASQFVSFVLSPQQPSPKKDTPLLTPFAEHNPKTPSNQTNYSLSTIQEDAEYVRTPFSIGKTSQEKEFSVPLTSDKPILSPKLAKTALEKASEDSTHPLYQNSFIVSPLQQAKTPKSSQKSVQNSITIFETNVIRENTVYEPANTQPERTAAVDLNATLSEIVEISSLIREVVEAEIPTEPEKLDNFSDK
jgi:hypothetical protein